jgi:hypothetical protein
MNELPRNTFKIRSQNINKSLIAQHDLLQMAGQDYDLILIQEPYLDFNSLSCSNAYYNIIYPTGHHDNFKRVRSRSIILVN